MKTAVLLLLFGLCAAVVLEPHFGKAPACVRAKNCGQSDWVVEGDAKPKHAHEVTFAVKRKNIEFLKAHLSVLSDLDSPFYGKWFKAEEVHKLTAFPEAEKAVKKWLRNANLRIESTKTGDYITAYGTVEQFTNLLTTKFYQFRSPAVNKTINRAFYTNVPGHIAKYIDFVSGVHNFPATLRPRMSIQALSMAANGVATPTLIKKHYKITPKKVATAKATQAVFEALGQSYSPSDLSEFESKYDIPAQKIAKVVGPNQPSECQDNPNACAEASLDVQYIIGIAPGAPTTFWSILGNGDIFLQWAKAVLNANSPPLVHSISYGSIEKEEDPASLKRFDQDMMTLGTRGLTIFVASGDDGVANFQARNNPGACGFSPSFPATSPHVVSVGATQGPEVNQPEIACSSKTGGLITTGGGFSTVFSAPSWQSAITQDYISNGPNMPPKSMFNANGRGYPDIAMLGHSYNVAIGGQFYVVSGTSCSTPVSAAVTTLVNGMRLAAGKSSLGYITEAIYKARTAMHVNPLFHDITSGENNCCAGQVDPVCCQYGFTAWKGWDPLCGWGSIKFSPFAAHFKNM